MLIVKLLAESDSLQSDLIFQSILTPSKRKKYEKTKASSTSFEFRYQIVNGDPEIRVGIGTTAGEPFLCLVAYVLWTSGLTLLSMNLGFYFTPQGWRHSIRGSADLPYCCFVRRLVQIGLAASKPFIWHSIHSFKFMISK